ncbi:Gfo/Idh/MocA family oxidoreductase [Vibrio breoganii]
MKVLLVGTGQMAVDYASVLNDIENVELFVIGRGQLNCDRFESKTGIKPFFGGIENQSTMISGAGFDKAIVAVGVENLSSVCQKLIDYGIGEILVEKPAGVDFGDVVALDDYSTAKGAKVFVAYNRRFYVSVLEAEKIIQADGGVQSFQFEVSEWSHVIGKLDKPKAVLDNWFVANSTHVVDLAFYLGGTPQEMSSYQRGGTDWHERSSRFYGAGVTDDDVLFSYSGNWVSPGRWGLEFNTQSHRLIFRPMERLIIQRLGSISQTEVDLDYSIDLDYKPGLYKQTSAFLFEGQKCKRLCTLKEHVIKMRIYSEIAGY